MSWLAAGFWICSVYSMEEFARSYAIHSVAFFFLVIAAGPANHQRRKQRRNRRQKRKWNVRNWRKRSPSEMKARSQLAARSVNAQPKPQLSGVERTSSVNFGAYIAALALVPGAWLSMLCPTGSLKKKMRTRLNKNTFAQSIVAITGCFPGRMLFPNLQQKPSHHVARCLPEECLRRLLGQKLDTSQPL